MQSYIFTAKKFIFCSYRIEQAITIPFQNAKLSNEFKIHEQITYAVNIHRKGIESVFNQKMELFLVIIVFNSYDNFEVFLFKIMRYI